MPELTDKEDNGSALTIGPGQTSAQQFRIVHDLIMQGHSYANIREEAAANGVNVDSMIAETFRVHANLASLPANVHYGWAIEAYRELYLKSITIADLANAKACVDKLVATAQIIAKEQSKRGPQDNKCAEDAATLVNLLAGGSLNETDASA